MSKDKPAQKTVTYRRFVATPAQERTLQQMMSSALTNQPTAQDRTEPLNAQSTELRVICDSATLQGCLCGYLTTYERGASQPVVEDTPQANKLKLNALAPPAPSRGAVQQQYVPGVVFFAVHQNHVALVQVGMLRHAVLENHLNWLLKSKTTEMAVTTSFVLSNEAQKATKEKIRKSRVKSIAIGQPLMVETASDQNTQQKKGAKQRVWAVDNKFKALLDGILGGDGAFEDLQLPEIYDGNLEIWIEIKYPKRKRSAGEDATALLNTLGASFRNIDAEEVELRLANGMRVKGEELRVASKIGVHLQKGKVPDVEKLYIDMSAWLSQQLANGTVDV